MPKHWYINRRGDSPGNGNFTSWVNAGAARGNLTTVVQPGDSIHVRNLDGTEETFTY